MEDNNVISESSTSLSLEGNKSEKNDKYQLTAKLKSIVADQPDILAYIEFLQKTIVKLKKKIKKAHSRKKKTKTTATQTEIQTDPPAIERTITEEIAEAAEQAVLTSGLAFDQTSGLYYDYKTGYYYNAEYGLYYDGNTGTYMTYDQDSDTYHFHSKVEVEEKVEKKPKKRRKSVEKERNVRENDKDDQKRSRYHRHDNDNVSDSDVKKTSLSVIIDLEEGECSDNSLSRDRDRGDRSRPVNNSNNRCLASSDDDNDDSSDRGDNDVMDDLTKQYPPCIRVIIEESTIPTIRKGSLHVIPYTGGSLGREGQQHVILLPDINISKHHLKFTYEEENKRYVVADLGSRNGTLLNGTRMAPSKQESDLLELTHGSRIQIGGTVMLCHIHQGSQTCGHCEPGLIQVEDNTLDIKEMLVTKNDRHRKELKTLMKKFGVSTHEQGKVDPGLGYKDRAQNRRETVGSQNPHEKTKVASLNESISSENKGFKMLSKMGWSAGKALGKDGSGRLNPVELVSNPGTSGMGTNSAIGTPSLPVTKKAEANSIKWLKTRQRFDKIKEKPASNIFSEGEDDEVDY